jgi:hypothetical protein
MNSSQSHYLKLFSALVFLMLLLIELVCFALYKLNPGEIIEWRYYESSFDNTSKSDLPFGWSSPEGLPRPDQAPQLTTCARAFGDSFTYGEEVYPRDAWPNLASSELGCRIENFGVGGFGTDQAYVLYGSTQTNTPIVILGIYPEMLRRNLAASWLFYGGQKDRSIKPYFKLNNQGNLEQIAWPASSSTDSLKHYHRHDKFFKFYDIQFPYFWHLTKSVFYQVKTRLENKGIFFEKQGDALPLQLALLNAFRTQAIARGSEMVLVFFPTLSELANNKLSYSAQLNAYKTQHPNACVIDTGPALLAATKAGEALGAPHGHFNPTGNAIVATEVVKGLQTCKNTKILITTDIKHR